MNFLEKLDFLMEKFELNKSSLSQKSNIPYTTIDGWYKKGYEGLKLPTLRKLASYFNTTLDYWVLDEITDPNYGKNSGFSVSFEEMEHIKLYRGLDASGKKHVNTVMQWESARVEQIADLENRTVIADPAPVARTCSRIYPYMHKIAAAGVGFYFDDIPTDTLEAPYRDDADFIIGVNGDSMEPTYYDGDLVYVQKRQVVEPGDIGIFIVDGECYIKEAGEECLISHNPKYKPISGGKEINCVGKVLGKVK